MKYLRLAICFLLFISCDKEEDLVPATMYFPPNNSSWESTSPASLGWDVTKLEALNTFLATNNTRGFIILKDGKIVVEEYFGKQFNNVTDFSVTSNWYWASAGKTLTSILAGIAEEQGSLNFDAKTSDYLGVGWTSLTPVQENQITVRHQLTMTTGLDDGVDNPDCTTPACLVFKAAPGNRWAYHNAPYTLLDDVIANSTGKNLNTFLNDNLKGTTGMDGQYIPTGENNVYYSTVRSMARFGLLLLNKGKWNDVQVVPADYIDLLATSSRNLNLSYGYLTWLNGKASFMAPGSQLVIPSSVTPNAPADMFAAMGKNGQLINIVPSQNLIMIRVGDVPDNSLVPFLFQDDIWDKLNEIGIKK